MTHPCFTFGYRNAQHGQTANPYQLGSDCSDEWIKGYDHADAAGLALFPRFGKLTRKRR